MDIKETDFSDVGVRVLLVEDCSKDIQLIEAALDAEMKCQVTVAATAAAFEDALKGEPPHIIVADSNLCTFDGLSALTLASRRCPHIPFVFCSGSESLILKSKAMARGATSWVSKDDGFAQLVGEVKRLCGQCGQETPINRAA